jgi:hypothetical protein
LNECTESRAGFGRGTALGPAWIALLGLLGFLGAPSLQAQEMEPRNYSPAPVGLRLAGLGYGESRGDINFDPSLAVENAEATIGVTMGFFASTFAMFDRPWRVSVLLPYFDGELTGRQGGVDRRIARYGPGDARLSLAVTFAGLEPLSPAEFARREKRTTWGASLTVAAPTGEYDPNLLINIGANRSGLAAVREPASRRVERQLLLRPPGAWHDDQPAGDDGRARQPAGGQLELRQFRALDHGLQCRH